MKCESHFEATKHNTATQNRLYLAATEIIPCLAIAAIPITQTETICKAISSAFRHLYATLQLLQFTVCDQYLTPFRTHLTIIFRVL